MCIFYVYFFLNKGYIFFNDLPYLFIILYFYNACVVIFSFLSEREAADRNYAIGFYMKENKCYPEKANLKDIMDFYFQVCSIMIV